MCVFFFFKQKTAYVMRISDWSSDLCSSDLSSSAPIGLYVVTPPDRIVVGDMVIAWPPDTARRLGAQRRYIPFNVPLVKRVAAAPGDTVCALGPVIFVEGRAVARRLDRKSTRLNSSH